MNAKIEEQITAYSALLSQAQETDARVESITKKSEKFLAISAVLGSSIVLGMAAQSVDIIPSGILAEATTAGIMALAGSFAFSAFKAVESLMNIKTAEKELQQLEGGRNRIRTSLKKENILITDSSITKLQEDVKAPLYDGAKKSFNTNRDIMRNKFMDQSTQLVGGANFKL